jgi:hypothetical protein
MTTMISEVYEAFKEANVSDASARRAAEAIASYESRFNGLELKIEALRGDVTLIEWMLGVVVAAIATLLLKAFA